jgi:transcriptional regulator with XRE-family HTH domain
VARATNLLFPALLRDWRSRRGMSQLDLAIAADVSSRHVSFLETARADPSREMVLRLAGALNVPLRDQNALLRASGFAEEFAEPSVTGGLAPSIAHALDRMFAMHEPFPIAAVDRRYDVLRMNDGGARILSRFVLDPSVLAGRANLFVALFDPRAARPFVVDWERVAHGMIARLHREVLARSGDADLAALLRALLEYPGVPPAWRQPDFSAPSEPTLTLRMRRDGLDLSFLTTITSFSAPQNVTLEELRIESYFPLDDATATACEALRTGP